MPVKVANRHKHSWLLTDNSTSFGTENHWWVIDLHKSEAKSTVNSAQRPELASTNRGKVSTLSGQNLLLRLHQKQTETAEEEGDNSQQNKAWVRHLLVEVSLLEEREE